MLASKLRNKITGFLLPICSSLRVKTLKYMSSSNLAWLDLAQPVLKLHSCITMSELFQHRDNFDAVLKQLDEIAKDCAEHHFSSRPVSAALESSEQGCHSSFATFLTPENLQIQKEIAL